MRSAYSAALLLRSTLLPLDAGRCLLVLHYLRRRYREVEVGYGEPCRDCGVQVGDRLSKRDHLPCAAAGSSTVAIGERL